MIDLLTSVWDIPASRFFPYGFVVAGVALLGFLVFDLREAARESAARKNGPMKFRSPYREDDGTSIFFYDGDDASEGAAQAVPVQSRRASR